MRKIISLLLSLLLVVCIFIINENDINAASVSIKGTGVSVKEGDTFKVTVAVSGATVTSGSISISCSSSLEIVSGQWALSGTSLAQYDSSSKKGAFAFAAAKSLSGNYFTITLRAKSVDQKATINVSVSLKNGSENVSGGNASGSIKVICATHSFGEWTTKDPTCTSNGSKSRTCNICKTVESQTIAALGHNVSNYVITKEPTCLESGTKNGKCDRCGQNVTVKVDPKGHSFGSWSEKEKATCTQHGIEIRYCSRCDGFETRETDYAQHVISNEYTILKEATLTKAGVIESQCINCGATFEIESDCSYKDEFTGIQITCPVGTFVEDTIIKITKIDNKDDQQYIDLINSIDGYDGELIGYNFSASLNSDEISNNKPFMISFDIPEEFSDKVCLLKVTDEGSIKVAESFVEDGKLHATINEMGTYSLINLATTKKVNNIWLYTSIGEAAIILALAYLLTNKKK